VTPPGVTPARTGVGFEHPEEGGPVAGRGEGGEGVVEEVAAEAVAGGGRMDVERGDVAEGGVVGVRAVADETGDRVAADHGAEAALGQQAGEPGRVEQPVHAGEDVVGDDAGVPVPPRRPHDRGQRPGVGG
jgi:hypothetical protein